MTKMMEQLYYSMIESIELDEEAKTKMQALATAKLAIYAELDQICDEKYRPLLEVLDTLEGEKEELHSRVLFEKTLETGMELGRLQIS